MTFYRSTALAFLAVIPLIVFLYLLKQKYQEQTISSLYLWREALRDMEANAPWQRLRKNILMFLQIAAAILLVLAMADPFLQSVGRQPGSVILVMDTSMSMQAEDVNPSRMDAARRKAENIVSSLRPGTAVTLICAGDSIVIEENLNDNKNRVLQKIRSVNAGYGTADMEGVWSLLDAIRKQQPDSEVILLGDSSLGVLPAGVRFVDVSGEGENCAILLLSYKTTKNGLTVLSRIANYGAVDTEVPLSLYADGKVLDAKSVKIGTGETANVYWEVEDDGVSVLECRIDRKDALEADNSAYACVNPENRKKVLLITPGNIFIEKIVSLIQGVELFKGSVEDKKTPEGYDLYIFDGFLPEVLPKAGNILVFNPGPSELFASLGEVMLPEIKKSNHVLFQYVNDYSFTVGSSQILDVPVWGEEVLGSEQGTLMFSGQYQGKRLLVFGFDLHHTDLSLTAAFPMMMTGVLEWLMPSAVSMDASFITGREIEFVLNPSTELARVVRPDGKTVPVAPSFPAEAFRSADIPGVYRLEQEGSEKTDIRLFAVNVPAQAESNLKGQQALSEVDDGAEGLSGESLLAGMKLQRLLLGMLLLLLLIEWWVYCHAV